MTCHRDRGSAWAAKEIRQRGGRTAAGVLQQAEAFHRLDRGRSGADAAALAVASDEAQAAIVRASALVRVASRGVPGPAVVGRLLGDPAAIVRRAALGALSHAGEADRMRLATPLLSDPVRTVRIEAARTLADVADRGLTGPSASAFESAFREWAAAERFSGDRPEAQVELGTAWLMRGRVNEAIAAFKEALALDPAFTPASVNLADAERLRGNEAEAERVLRQALASGPEDAGLRHALGLSLVRQKRSIEALAELREAARLDPSSARYGYVLGVALRDGGRLDDALDTLVKVFEAHPADRDTLTALVLFNRDAGRLAAARLYVGHLLALDPAAAAVRQLAASLGVAVDPARQP
jgi:tetratricopeptide (TPR) repeat protein